MTDDTTTDPTALEPATFPERLSVEWIAGLFTKHGIEPNAGTFLDVIPHPCGCADGAIAAEFAGGVNEARRLWKHHNLRSFSRFLESLANLPLDYTEGISYGFSGGRTAVEHILTRPLPPLYRAGVEDGRAVRKRVLPETA